MIARASLWGSARRGWPPTNRWETQATDRARLTALRRLHRVPLLGLLGGLWAGLLGGALLGPDAVALQCLIAAGVAVPLALSSLWWTPPNASPVAAPVLVGTARLLMRWRCVATVATCATGMGLGALLGAPPPMPTWLAASVVLCGLAGRVLGSPVPRHLLATLESLIGAAATRRTVYRELTTLASRGARFRRRWSRLAAERPNAAAACLPHLVPDQLHALPPQAFAPFLASDTVAVRLAALDALGRRAPAAAGAARLAEGPRDPKRQ